MGKILESELATSEALNNNDFVRIVTSGGESRNIKVSDSIAAAKQGYGYGVCDTASGVTEKEVAIDGYIAKVGGIVNVMFVNDVDADSTLNINGQGDIPIYMNGSPIIGNIIMSGEGATFIYDGTNYVMLCLDYRRLFKRDIPADLIESKQFTKDNITISAGGLSGNQTFDLTWNHRVPLMATVSLANASSSGVNVSGCYTYMQSFSASGQTCTVQVKNAVSSQAKIKITVTAIYRSAYMYE